MAGRVYYPWENDYGTESETTVSAWPKYQDVIIDNLAELSKMLVIDDKFLQFLQEKNVLSEKTIIKNKSVEAGRMRCSALLFKLLSLKVYQLHGFIWAAVNTGQLDIARKLGFSPEQYIDVGMLIRSSSLACPSCLDVYSCPYLFINCGHFVCRPCAKGAKLVSKNDKNEGITCPVTDCGISSVAKPTESNDIGLDNDTHYGKQCKVFHDKIGPEIVCSNCQKAVGFDDLRHKCEQCDSEFCHSCVYSHIEHNTDHSICHQHLNRCCLDGRTVESFCDTCKLYLCRDCENVCSHTKTSEDFPLLEFEIEADLDSLHTTASQCNDTYEDMNTVLAEKADSIDKCITTINTWATSRKQWFLNIQKKVEKRRHEAKAWIKTLGSLNLLQKARPWMNFEVDMMDKSDEESANLVDILRTDAGPSKLFMSPPFTQSGQNYEGPFILTTPPISDLDEIELFSPCFRLGPTAWSLSIRQYANSMGRKYLSVYTHCKVMELDAVKAKMIISILPWKKGKPCYVQGEDDEPVLRTKDSWWGWHGFILWSKLVNPENCYVQDDKINLRLDIKMIEPSIAESACKWTRRENIII